MGDDASAMTRIDPRIQGERLVDLLLLADALPSRHSDSIGTSWYDEVPRPVGD